MEAIGIGAGLAAIGFWLFIAAAVGFGVWDGIRKREARHETLRRLIAAGDRIDEAIVDKILGNKNKDLARELKIAAIITGMVVPGLVVLAFVLGQINPQATPAVLGAAAIVAFVAAGLFIGSRMVAREDATQSGYRGRSVV
jgi:hypothetical protein